MTRLLRALELLLTILCVLVLLAAPFAILYGYSVWAGDCVARGGRVVGTANETHCEGAR